MNKRDVLLAQRRQKAFNERQAKFARDREKLNHITEGYYKQHFHTDKVISLPPPKKRQGVAHQRRPPKKVKKLKRSNKARRVLVNERFYVKRQDVARINAFALKLQTDLPKSEVWFQLLYNKHKNKHDCYNTPLGYYIPDVSNMKFKYVVEVDGSIHNEENIKARDVKKNEYYFRHGYRVIRITAYSEQSFEKALFILQTIRNGSTLQFDSQLAIDEFMATQPQPPLFGP